MEVVVNAPVLYPEIARYNCYRVFLKDFFAYKKSLRSGFSYRQFSTLVGLRSPNYLQLVIQGKRNLTETTGRRLVEALKLSTKEINYFEALIRFDNAENEAEKIKAQKLMHANLKKLLTRFVAEDAQEILNKWYYLLIREMVTLKGFEASGEYISKRLKGVLTASEAEKAFAFLIKAGYLKNENGRYVQHEPVLDTGLDIFNHSFMQEYHGQMLKTWAQNIEKLGYKNQELGVLSIPLPKNKIPELQEKIRQFQDEVIGWAQNYSDNDDLVQLGTYLMHWGEEESSEA